MMMIKMRRNMNKMIMMKIMDKKTMKKMKKKKMIVTMMKRNLKNSKNYLISSINKNRIKYRSQSIKFRSIIKINIKDKTVTTTK